MRSNILRKNFKSHFSCILILKNKAFFSLEIITISHETIELTRFLKITTNTKNFDRYQFYIMSRETRLFQLNYSDFDPILVSCEYFRKK